jgi:branched-chain amino acid transport system permease protein
MKKRSDVFWIGCAVAVGLALLAALTVHNEYFFFAGFIVVQFIVLATAWNILGGYAGYVNFGTGAFFGLGAYVAVFLFKTVDAPLPVQILLAAGIGAALGFGTGWLTLRLRGIFFSIATFAVAIVLQTAVMNWRFLGGSTGLQLLRPETPPPFDSYVKMIFVVAVGLSVVTISIARYIERSWIGLGLRAIRDNEAAAESSGVPTLRLKLFACSASGALMSAMGALLPMYMSFIEPDGAFNLNYSASALAMAIIGGTSSWVGPVIGAILIGTTQQIVTVTVSSELNVLVVGVLLVMFVVLAPQGILGLMGQLRDRIGGRWTKAREGA